WPRQCGLVSHVGWREHRLAAGSGDAAGGAGDASASSPDHFLRRAVAVRGLAGAARPWPGPRLRSAAAVHFRRGGGARPSPAVVGVDILDGLGSTEMLQTFLSNRPGEVRYGSTGKPVPGYDVKIVDENGRELPDGEIGELVVRGPSAGESYWNQRAKSRRTFV